MGTQASIYLPDGQPAWLPVAPRTWADAGTGAKGDALRAPLVEADAGSATAWHRQRPLFQAFGPTPQTIATSTWTPITPLSELVDNYAGHSDSANTSRYYVPATNSCTTGGDWYLCSGYVPWNSTATASVFIAGLRETGSATIMEGGKMPSGAGHAVDTMCIDLMQMHGGNNDYVELVTWQNSGAAQSTLTSAKTPSLTVRWVAPDQAWAGVFTPTLPATPHVWTDADIWTGSATGGAKVAMNTELRDLARFLNNPPAARLTAQGGSQTIPNGGTTWTSINYTATGKSLDNYGGWAVANPSRYTCQRAGLYLVAGYVSVAEAATTSGYRTARLLQTFAAGGSQAYAGWTTLPQTAGTTGTAIYAIGLVRMAAGDYVETQMQHTNTSAGLAVNVSAAGASRMIAVWLAK